MDDLKLKKIERILSRQFSELPAEKVKEAAIRALNESEDEPLFYLEEDEVMGE